jgi:hypothetical protein
MALIAAEAGLAEQTAGLNVEPDLLARICLVEGVAWFRQGCTRPPNDVLTSGAQRDTDLRGPLLVQAFYPAWYLGERYLDACLDMLATVE